jgi:hypothetical protein
MSRNPRPPCHPGQATARLTKKPNITLVIEKEGRKKKEAAVKKTSRCKKGEILCAEMKFICAVGEFSRSGVKFARELSNSA